MGSNNFVVEVVTEGRGHYILVNFYLKDQVYVLPGKKYFDFPDEYFFKLRNDVVMGKKITIKKALLDNGDYSIDDFVEREVSDFEKEKYALMCSERSKISGLAMATSFFEIYEFIAVTGMLASQGLFLTDENREETYLNIINTGNEELINALERYLEIKDSMDTLVAQYRQICDYLHRIRLTDSIDELNAVTKTRRNNESLLS